jgi:hypothetical protein
MHFGWVMLRRCRSDDTSFSLGWAYRGGHIGAVDGVIIDHSTRLHSHALEPWPKKRLVAAAGSTATG